MRCLNDVTAVGGLGFGSCLEVTQTFGSAHAVGGRNGAAFTTILQAPTSTSNPNRNYVALSAEAKANTGDGGVLGGELGAVFGANLVSHAFYGATNLFDVAGSEVNFGLYPGASSAYLIGLDVVANANGAAATRGSAAIGIGAGGRFTAKSNSSGATATFSNLGLNYGIWFSTKNSQYPVANNGTLLYSDASTVANGVDFSNLDITGYLIKGPNGAGITGAGAGLFSRLSVAATPISGDGTNLIATGYRETLTTPASSSAACKTGQFTDDANYHYVCVATNTWKRAALSTF